MSLFLEVILCMSIILVPSLIAFSIARSGFLRVRVVGACWGTSTIVLLLALGSYLSQIHNDYRWIMYTMACCVFLVFGVRFNRKFGFRK